MKVKENKLYERLTEIIRRTTFHAIPSMFNSERILIKIMWGIFLVISSSACFYYIYTAVEGYLQNEVSTKMVLEKPDEIEFPTVTFCNLQICGFSEYNFNDYLKKYKQDEQVKFGTSQDEVINEKLKKNSTKTSFFSAKEVFLRKYPDTELIRILSRNKTLIKNQLITCEFDGEKCNENDFEFFTMGEFQKCYKFNSGKFFNDTPFTPRKSTKFGQKTGLHLELYVGTQSECQSPLSSTSGLIVYVHNKTYTLTEEDDAIQIQPGTEANIAIESTFVKKLSAPFSDCLESVSKIDPTVTDTKLIYRTINLTKIYTQQYCLQLCYQAFLIDFCDCYDHTLPNYSPDGYSACPKFIDSLYNCQYLIKRLFYNGKNDEHCLKLCPKECDYMSFSSTVSYLKFPTQNYVDQLSYLIGKGLVNINGSMQAPEESLLAVNVFYKGQMIKKITEQPAIEFGIFVSNIGGTLGLFLGVSVLVIVEFIEIILEVLFALFAACKNGLTKNKDN